jgi:hypothetical protein
VPHHPQPGYKRDARMDKSIIIHMIIRTPSRVSLQTFINFVYLSVNKHFTTQTTFKSGSTTWGILLKVAPNVGHDVKSGSTTWGLLLKNKIEFNPTTLI